MNYEKKYKDALERAKEKYAMFEGMKQGDILEDVFPDLKESEDGSIRNAIHIYLDWLDGRKDYAPKGEYSIRDMIAWIEKQGKQNPAWSEEDEKMFNSALWHIKNSCGNQGKNSGEFEVYNWLKTIKYRYLPQPKHEWSEEDEKTIVKMRDFFIRVLGDKPDFTEDKRYEEFIEFIDNRLKSLKDRYTWRPSDEQINALQTAILIVGDLTSTASLLNEIREQLKKLREE